jgi:GNAT superfamily N-acetyltransferase
MDAVESPPMYVIEDFAGFTIKEEPTARAGFSVRANFGDPAPEARGFEGYCVERHANGTEQVEIDVFNLSWVDVHNERGKGIGTALITQALAEAKKRKFHIVRMELENYKAAKIIQKLGQIGVVTNVRFALSRLEDRKLIDVIPTHKFSEHPVLITADEAIGYLNFLAQDKYDGLVCVSPLEVECVFELK